MDLRHNASRHKAYRPARIVKPYIKDLVISAEDIQNERTEQTVKEDTAKKAKQQAELERRALQAGLVACVRRDWRPLLKRRAAYKAWGGSVLPATSVGRNNRGQRPVRTS